MIAMERFTQRAMILLLITILECLTSKIPFGLLFLAGALLCIICERSLMEEEKGICLALQFMLSLIFVLLSQNYISYLLFYLIGGEVPTKIRKSYSFLFPAIVYFGLQILLKQQELPEIILHVLILTGISGGLFLLQQLIENYIHAKSQISKALSVMAVNEMYAKKLNQELVIKNYLADKTARLEERENISRNIHNSVGHSITAAVMTLDAADMLFDTAPDKAREKMNTANQRIRGSLDFIRQAVRVLNHENQYVSMSDFISELTAVTDGFVMDTMIKIYTDFGNINMDVVIPHEHTEFLTGVVQELLSNGVRHGGADVFSVTLTADSRHIKIKVKDNGKSDFSKKNQRERIENGFGLKKIISYVKRCGGSVDFSNENGFKAEILLEFQKGEEE
ncbi:MAG: hypothetical protein IJA32_03325 [Lachnospiraceae bacterium]|nr:hypothetical protein [Lachnospiraceae bacterium]